MTARTPAWPTAARGIGVLLLALAGGGVGGDARAAGAADGESLFVDRCGRCHGLLGKGAQLPAHFVEVVVLPLGPNLTGVYGRPAGTVAGYRYSNAFREAARDLVWDEANLDRWLADSRAMIPGTYMLVKTDAAERAAIIDYLKAAAKR